jgi:hypothetical protein
MTVVQTLIVVLLIAVAMVQSAPARTLAPSLQGVTLGESARAVNGQLGLPLKDRFESGSVYWTYSADSGNARLEVTIRQGNVSEIVASLYGLTSSLSDQYRVTLGDPESRITSLRGQPDFARDLEQNGRYLRYGSRGDVYSWYQLSDGKVVDIGLTAATNWDSWSYPVPSPSSTPWPTMSLGSVLLGETPADVRRQFGTPNDEDNASGLTSSLTYRFDSNKSELVTEFHHGVTTTISTSLRTLTPSSITDPFGIALGDKVAKLVSVRGQPDKQTPYLAEYKAGPGVKWTYILEKGEVAWIALDASVTVLGTPPPTTVGNDGRDGSTPEKAVMSKGEFLDDTAAFESLYVSSLRCDGQGVWHVKTHEDQTVKGRVLGQYDAECTTSKRATTFYFDHTAAESRDR